MRVDQAKLAESGCRDALRQLRNGEPTSMKAWLKDHLFGHVLPFWERHAMDPRGGIFTCIGDDGTIVATEKWIWSQWRAVWVFSRIYRSLDRDPRWLNHARQIARFCIRHAWDNKTSQWMLLVAQDGKVLRGHESTYVDAFAVYGLLELHLATGESEPLRLARATADAALHALARPRDTMPHFPYPIPAGSMPHGIPMLWSLKLAELGQAVKEPRYLETAAALSDEIFDQFYRRDRQLCLELIRADGRELPAPAGTAVVPGHAIEDMWFQIRVAEILGRTAERLPLAATLISRHLEAGWDHRHGGGLLLAIDADGRDTVGWNFPDTKLWWPHTEALYATLRAWKLTGAVPFLDWYERLWTFCLQHYVDWEHGEWRQKLNRDLTLFSGTIALPVKDPFHLPRSLILQIEALR